jgi:MFS superfamily sulfate permease-like transporter
MVDSAGGRTQLSVLVTALIVLLVLLFFTAPLAYMPEAVLSAVVFLIALGLIDIKGMYSIFVQRRSEFWVALITTVTVVIIGVEDGILLAIALSLIEHTRHGYRPKNDLLVPIDPGDPVVLHTLPLASRSQASPGLLIYRFTDSMYYANTQQLTDEITALVSNSGPPLRWFCMDTSAVSDVDYSAAETLRSIYATLKEKGIRLVLANVLEGMDDGGHYELRRLFGEDAFYDTLQDVVKDYQQQMGAGAHE